MYDGWSGALSRSTYDLCRFYNLGPEAERAVRDVIRSYKVLEITDAALFCKAARNEPREFYTDESSFAEVISQLQPPMPTKYATFPPELDMAMIRAMIGSVEASSSFRPTEHLEQHINDMFTDVKIPPHITKIMLPVEAELPMSTPDQLRDCVSKRLVPISNQLYAAAKFPYRWFCKGDKALLAALRDLRDPEGHIVSPTWITTDCILEIAKPVEIAAFITPKNLEELNLAGQAVHVVRSRENVLPSSGETDRKNSPWHSEDSYAKALIAQMGANFWFTGASVGSPQCFWDGHFMVMAQVIENGQHLDIHFSRVVAAGSRFSPYLQQITVQTLHASVADHIKTATETAKRRQEALKLKLHDIETAQKELLAAMTKAEDRMEGTEVALCCAKEQGNADAAMAENEVEECKKMQLATSAAATKMASEAKIAKEKYEEAKAAVDDLQDARASERESGVLHDEHPLPYVDCGRNILGGGLHGIVCDGEFHDVHGMTIPVVVKMPRLSRKMAELNEAAEAMEHELQVYKALHRIQGSVIPRLYGCGYVDDWYSGRSIPALVLENAGEKNLTSPDISTLTDDEKLDIIDVLGTFHKKGWVHGDIAERNILYSIDTNGRKKFRLCDLALAEKWECREDTRDETFNLFEILYITKTLTERSGAARRDQGSLRRLLGSGCARSVYILSDSGGSPSLSPGRLVLGRRWQSLLWSVRCLVKEGKYDRMRTEATLQRHKTEDSSIESSDTLKYEDKDEDKEDADKDKETPDSDTSVHREVLKPKPKPKDDDDEIDDDDDKSVLERQRRRHIKQRRAAAAEQEDTVPSKKTLMLQMKWILRNDMASLFVNMIPY
ncbi:hypothetical protein ARMSODRAFT_973750 [Armillaria solidipes]|uniref:Uncharacterized protein n=1 Tax=Armillaria solidipes TaxID=1076256 RepID=A0A2H3BZ20_9AGAR|nr:hypothetical protein ARMSODRAFT_973750 [Armillaria solidipes]